MTLVCTLNHNWPLTTQRYESRGLKHGFGKTKGVNKLDAVQKYANLKCISYVHCKWCVTRFFVRGAQRDADTASVRKFRSENDKAFRVALILGFYTKISQTLNVILILATSFGLKTPSSGQYLKKKLKNANAYSTQRQFYGIPFTVISSLYKYYVLLKRYLQ
jgi:hypothetical protein